MRLCAFLFGAAVLLAGPAAAQPRAPAPVRTAPAPPQPIGPVIPTRTTARSLAAICNQNEGACLAYVIGAIDAFTATSVVNYGRSDLCFPAQATNLQVAGVAIAYLRAHPEMQDRNAAMVVIQGLRGSFPCH